MAPAPIIRLRTIGGEQETTAPITARRKPADRRLVPLRPFGTRGEERILDLLEGPFLQTIRRVEPEYFPTLLRRNAARYGLTTERERQISTRVGGGREFMSTAPRPTGV